MADMNKVLLTGRLTKDPERKDLPGGVSMAKFSLAVGRRKGRDQEEALADFPNCIAFRSTADYLLNYLHKGDKIWLSGRIQTGKYEDSTGRTVYTTDVVADDVSVVSQKQEPVQFSDPKPTPKPEPVGNQIQFDYGTRNRTDTIKLGEMEAQDLSGDDLPF